MQPLVTPQTPAHASELLTAFKAPALVTPTDPVPPHEHAQAVQVTASPIRGGRRLSCKRCRRSSLLAPQRVSPPAAIECRSLVARCRSCRRAAAAAHLASRFERRVDRSGTPLRLMLRGIAAAVSIGHILARARASQHQSQLTLWALDPARNHTAPRRCQTCPSLPTPSYAPLSHC